MRILTRRLFAGVVIVIVLSVASACQSEQPPRSSTVFQRDYPTPARPLNLPGQVVFAPGDGSLWLQNANGSNARVLVKSAGQSYASSPAFSPDGKQVAYVLTTYDQNGNARGEIRVNNLAGNSERVIVTPPDNKTLFNFPAWSPDGKELWFTRTSVVSDTASDEIERINIAGGAAQRVLDGGRAATVSPDGNKIAFQCLDFKTYHSSLWVADVDGSHPRQLLDQEVFASLQGARFSPDSRSLAFAASGAPQKPLPGLQSRRDGTGEIAQSQTTPADACLVSFLFTCWVNTAYAHGQPWELWLADLDGTKFEQLTHVGADSPYPAWSPDGKFVAYMDLSGFYVVNRETKEGNLISINGGHGALDWR